MTWARSTNYVVQWSLEARRRAGSAGRGICQQGFRKTHKRADPACRFHGTDVRGNVAVTRGEASRPKAHAAPKDSGRERTARPTQVPFTHMTRFVTKGGNWAALSPRTFGQMDKPRSQHAGGGMDRQPDRTTAQCSREGGI